MVQSEGKSRQTGDTTIGEGREGHGGGREEHHRPITKSQELRLDEQVTCYTKKIPG